MHDAIQDPWGPATPIGRGADWPERVDVHLADGVAADDVERWVQSASLLHSNGDAMDIAVHGGRIVGVRGRADDRVNRGRLGPKDLFGWQANASPDRLTQPLIRRAAAAPGRLGHRDGRSRSALPRAARRARARAIGFYTTGQLFCEEYWTLATIARGRDRHQPSGRQHPAVHRDRRRGAEGVLRLRRPARLLHRRRSTPTCSRCSGHNVAETQPVLWMRMLDRLDGPDPPRLVVVDPRRHRSPAERADVHLAPRPGTNLAAAERASCTS